MESKFYISPRFPFFLSRYSGKPSQDILAADNRGLKQIRPVLQRKVAKGAKIAKAEV